MACFITSALASSDRASGHRPASCGRPPALPFTRRRRAYRCAFPGQGSRGAGDGTSSNQPLAYRVISAALPLRFQDRSLAQTRTCHFSYTGQLMRPPRSASTPELGLQLHGAQPHTGLRREHRHLNSGPRAYLACTVPPEPSPTVNEGI